MALIPLYFPFFHCFSLIYGPKGTACENKKRYRKFWLIYYIFSLCEQIFIYSLNTIYCVK